MSHGDFIFTIHVHPGSRRAGVGGSHDGRLVVRVHARAIGGAANDEVLTSLASSLGVARSRVQFVHVTRSREKLVRVDEAHDHDELRARHAELLSAPSGSTRDIGRGASRREAVPRDPETPSSSKKP